MSVSAPRQLSPNAVILTDSAGFIQQNVIEVGSVGAAAIAIVDGSGNQITTFGGGTQYADGVTQATPTGTIALGKNPSNVLHALPLDASNVLMVNVVSGGGSGSNAAAGLTGQPIPPDADYQGVNIGGNLVGVTGLALGSAKAPTVAIVDGSGNQVTSFGGGTQFADNGASGATPTGTLSMGWDSGASKVRALKVDGSQNLNVAVQNSVAVTGTFFQATQPVSLAAAVDVSDRSGRLLGHVTVDNASIAVTGTFFQATQPVSIAAAIDVSDRAARLVGHVTVDNASIAVTGTFFQATQPVSIAGTVATDPIDRAARLLGIVYGTRGQLVQTATNNNLQVEIAVGGALVDPRAIRALTNADIVKVQLQDNAGTAITLGQKVMASSLPVVIASDQSAIPVTGTFFQVTQPVSIAAAIDVSDRSARLLGHVTVDNASIAVTGTFFQATQPVSIAATVATDPTDRSGRLLGHVTVDAMPAVTVGASSPVDEYGNKQMVAEDYFPWQQALLDEMRAVRLGIQVLCEYINPASGIPTQPNSPLNAAILRNSLIHNEVDLIAWAHSIRDGADELIQG